MDQEERTRLEAKYEGTLPRETKFLGSHPVIFIDEFINAVNDYACSGADEMEQFLSHEKTLVGQHEIVKEGVDAALKKLQDGIDNHLDKYELYLLSNIFKMPRDLIDPRQQSDTVMAEPVRPVTMQEEDDLDQTLLDLRREAQAELYVRNRLWEEKEQLESYLKVVQGHKEEIAVLRSISEQVNNDMVDVIKESTVKANELSTQMKADRLSLMECENAQFDGQGAPVGQVASMDGQYDQDIKMANNATTNVVSDIHKAMRV